MESKMIEDLARDVISTAEAHASYIRELRQKNTDRWREMSERREQHEEQKARSGIATAALTAGSAVSAFVGAQFMTAAGVSSLASLTVPAAIASAPVAGAFVGAAAALFYLGKGVYHAVAQEMTQKEMRRLGGITDEDLVQEDQERAARESLGIWDKALNLVRRGSAEGLRVSESDSPDVKRPAYRPQ